MSAIKRKISSYSGGENTCVAVGHDGNLVLIQDSKQDAEYADNPAEQPSIVFEDSNWPAARDLALSASTGEVQGAVAIELHADGAATFRGIDARDQPVKFEFDTDEMDAWTKGVADGEFDH
ncbi:DUF397 domain-containing protein [Nocardia sp. NBC_00565]|uniref:DUF397 domain-containing protein n=1 Tax=Nocardia sp. NBC_00565 TaxID=2975993 RepID=UPI002E80E921|nr:DUF397 domain-containing protein [Nocardia sp. NBC_00565]WUC02031.1 DUF397 domain-containing protein [Nocardia sp. NBC_00565]